MGKICRQCSTTLQKWKVFYNGFDCLKSFLNSLSTFVPKGDWGMSVWLLVSNQFWGGLRFIWGILNKETNTFGLHPPQGTYGVSHKHFRSFTQNFGLLHLPISNQLFEQPQIPLKIACLKVAIEGLLEKIENTLFSFPWKQLSPKVSPPWSIPFTIDELPPTKLNLMLSKLCLLYQELSFPHKSL
jgi:hypothetical protein